MENGENVGRTRTGHGIRDSVRQCGGFRLPKGAISVLKTMATAAAAATATGTTTVATTTTDGAAAATRDKNSAKTETKQK